MARLASSMYGKVMAAIAGLLLFAAPVLPAVACCCVRAEDESLKSAATCCHRASRTSGDTANANKTNAKETTKPEASASNAVKSCCKSRLTKSMTKSMTKGMAIESPADPCECCISGDLPLSQGVTVETVHLKSVMSDWLLYLLPLPASRDNSVAMRASSEADVFRTHNQNQALLCVWLN